MSNSIDLPFEPQDPVELDLSDAVVAAGVIVLSAKIPVNDGGDPLPGLVLRFTKADGSGFATPVLLVLEENTTRDLPGLIGAAIAKAIQ